MRNESSKYPGRIKLVSVPDTTDTFDTIDASEPIVEGTPLTAETLHSDEVAALIGSSTPTEAFIALAPLLGLALNQQAYMSAGTFTFTAPKSGWYIADVQAAGGGYQSSTTTATIGSGGGFVRARVLLNKGDMVTVTVGAPGTSSTPTGGTSSFGSHATAYGGMASTGYAVLGGSSTGGFFRVNGSMSGGSGAQFAGSGFLSAGGIYPYGPGTGAYPYSLAYGEYKAISFPGCVIVSWI